MNSLANPSIYVCSQPTSIYQPSYASMQYLSIFYPSTRSFIIHTSNRLSINPTNLLTIHNPSVHLPTHLFIQPHIHLLYIRHPSIHPSTDLLIHQHLSTQLFTTTSLSVCLSIHPSTSQSIHSSTDLLII